MPPSTPPSPTIEIDTSDDGLAKIYQWRPPGGNFYHYLAATLFVALFGAALAGGIFAIRQLIDQVNPVGTDATLLVVGILLLAEFPTLVATCYHLLRPVRCERVILSRTHFSHDPGSLSPAAVCELWAATKGAGIHPAFRILFQRRAVLSVPKPQFLGSVLDHRSGRQRLYFERDGHRIEIGEWLDEPDREWLHSVITEWKAA
jgi:hypothetical protein